MEEPEDEEVEVPDFVPLSFQLPKVRTVEQCPKCGVSVLDSLTEWHQYPIANGPCGQQFDLDDLRILGEHVCRICLLCGFGWVERVGD